MISTFFSPGSFYNLPSVNDFIIDILLGSPGEEVPRAYFDITYAKRCLLCF